MPIIGLGIDAREAEQGIDKYESSVNSGTAATGKLIDSTTKVSKSINSTGESFAAEAGAADKAAKSTRSAAAENDKAARALGGTAGAAERATTGVQRYSKEASDSAKSTRKLTDSAGKAETILGDLEKRLLATAAAYVGISQGIQLVGRAITTFSGFDKELRVAASYAQATSDEFRAMGAAAKEAGATTSKSASESAQGLSELASRGFSVKEQIAALVPTIRLAEAAQTDLAKATATSSGILRGFGKDVSELERINDVIVGISGISAANINFVGAAAKYAVPAARAAGEEFESVAAVIGVLADQQFEAGQSGNAFKNFLISVADPTARAAAELQKLGVETRNADGTMKGIIPIFEQLKDSNLDLVGASRIFGREFASAAVAVAGSIDEVNRDFNTLKTSVDGLTESTAEFQQGGLSGSLALLESATEGAFIAIGENLTPVIKDVAEGLAGFASNAGKVASVTTGLITGIEVLSQGFLGIYNTADIAVDGITGLLSLAVSNFPLYRGLELVAEGLEKIGVIEVNPFKEARKSIEEFAKAQDGSLARTQKRIEELNAKFAGYKRTITDSAAETERAAAAERNLAAAADKAGEAAGRQALAAGKSVEEALKAAQAATQAYTTQAEASRKQEEADKKATEAAAKRKTALEKQAAAVKKQALSFGATETAAQAAADKIIDAGIAADSVTGTGVDGLNDSLDETVEKAGQAKTALINIGSIGAAGAPTGGEISYSVGLSTGDYDKKIRELKEDVRAFNNEYQVVINTDPTAAEELRVKLEETRSELRNTQAIQDYNKQLSELRSEYRKTHQEFLGGKLTIDTDPAASAAIQAQINAVNKLKLSTEGLIPGMERVNGVWQQLPNTVAAAVQPAVASLGSMSDASGEIEIQWQQVGDTWRQVLPDGTVLIEDMNGVLHAGKEVAEDYGDAVAGIPGKAGGLSEVEKVLNEVEGQIKKTTEAAGTLKLDQLAASTGALNAVKGEISDLRKEIKTLDPTSAEATEAVKKLLSLEAVRGELSDKVSDLKKEIYDTGEESKKTGKKAAKAAKEIEKIPSATKKAADSVGKLAAATGELAASSAEIVQTQGDVARAAFSAAKTFTLTSSNNIEGINAEIAALKEEQRIIKEMNEIIFDRAHWTMKNQYARDIQQEEIQELEYKKFALKAEAQKEAFFGDKFDMTGFGKTEITNNFYDTDRSDAENITSNQKRMGARA